MLSILVLLVLGLAMTQRDLVSGSSSSCNFPAICNFGNSNSDTGGRSAALTQIPPPYGETNLGNPAKRLSNGHIILDFIRLPYVSAYLDSIGTNFRRGANFATGGSSILPGPFSPFDIGIQISQFKQFKSRTTELYKNLNDSGTIEKCSGMSLPHPDDFSKALYTFDIGQKDLTFGFQNRTVDQIVAAIPGILDGFNAAVLQLYGKGARVFQIRNNGPIGRLPLMTLTFKFRNGTLDQNGCIAYQNNVVQEFNQQLKERVNQLRNNLSMAAFTYINIYSAKLSLISDAKNQGFVDPLNYCCGTLVPTFVMCGLSAQVNGTTIHGDACSDPQDRISWDGIHFMDAANSWIASCILNGSMSDSPIPITNACP